MCQTNMTWPTMKKILRWHISTHSLKRNRKLKENPWRGGIQYAFSNEYVRYKLAMHDSQLFHFPKMKHFIHYLKKNGISRKYQLNENPSKGGLQYTSAKESLCLKHRPCNYFPEDLMTFHSNHKIYAQLAMEELEFRWILISFWISLNIKRVYFLAEIQLNWIETVKWFTRIKALGPWLLLPSLPTVNKGIQQTVLQMNIIILRQS